MKKNLLILFSLLIVVTAKGQWNYKASNAQNITGMYTDLGTAGSAITTNFSGGAMTFDDDNSSVQNIGFTFNFDGTAYTQFILNTNGFIKLGSGAVSAANIYYSVAQGSGSNTGGCVLASDADLIYAMNHDLGPATSGGLPEYRVSTSGAAGSRICTIQFKNLADKIGGTLVQFANINFQIQLYEGTGEIDFVYGPWTNSANPTNFITNAVGIKGLATANSVNVVKGSAGVWSTSSFINGNYAAAANTHNIRNSIMTGELGRTYRFYPTYPNDASVSVVYTLGKLPIPYVVPHTVSTRIINAGSNTLTNLPVSLSITGANTFTPPAQNIASLAPGDSITIIFPAFSPSNIGTNAVSVSVPTDDNNINNLFSLSQEITNNSYTYAYGAVPTSGVGFNGATGDFAALFTTNTPTSVNQVSVNFFTGGQPFQIGIWDKGVGGKPGTNIFTSASQISTTGVFTLPVSPPINITDTFFVGVMQSGTTNLQFAYQKESPIRPGVFFFTQPHLGTTWTDFAPNNAFRFMIEPRLTIANDVGISSINNPVGASSIDNCGIVPQADVTNFGSSNQTTPFDVTFSIKQSGSTVYSDTKQVSLNSGETQSVYFAPFTGSVSGSDSSFAVTSLATDGATNNDTVVNKFTTSIYSYSDSTLTSDGYSYANSTICASPAPLKPVYNWVTETSNEINWNLNGDDSVLTTPISIPFAFKFFGVDYNQFWIGSNGWISFSDPTAISAAVQRTPVNIPAAGGIENYIAGAFTDLDLTTGTYADAHTYYGGDATQSVITFQHAHLFGSITDFITFQIILKVNGDIIVQYNDAESSIPVSTKITNFCSVGIENSGGTKGILYRLNGSGGPMFGSPLALEYYARPGIVVPVTLLNFTVQRTHSTNKITWSTSQEINSRNFIIERSNDGRSFTYIGEVTASGNSSTVINYSFTDNTAPKGINYYRLRLVDLNNVSKYGPTRSVRNEGAADVVIYPNPVKQTLNLTVNADKADRGTISITDMSGKIVYSNVLIITEGTNNIPVNTNNLSQGIYLLKVKLSDDMVVKKFNKQ